MTPDPTFAAAAASARELGTYRHEGCGYVQPESLKIHSNRKADHGNRSR